MSTHVRHHPSGNAIVEIHATEDSWHGHYHFHTTGMTPQQIHEKHASIMAHHRAKSARHEGFNRLDRTVSMPGSGDFLIHALAIDEQGTDVGLIVRVTTPDGSVLNLDRVAPSVADLPSDAEIRTIASDAAAAWLNRKNITLRHVESVRTILGLQ